MATAKFTNPYRPGAGHMPTYLAGRDHEKDEFRRLLTQTVILENVIITGLRGVGKTVLLETLKPIAIETKWLWVGTDLSEIASLSENNIIVRMLTDLALVTSSISIGETEMPPVGYSRGEKVAVNLEYRTFHNILSQTPGLASDKLKKVLEIAAHGVSKKGLRGVVFAYDEAQNMSDHAEKEQYPLSLMLEVFQSLQRKNIPFMLLFTGLPTLMPKLIDARTYSEAHVPHAPAGSIG